MLTDREFETYDRDGFLRLGQVMTDVELAALQTRMDAIMLGRVVYPGMFFQIDTATGVYSDVGRGPKGWQGPSLNYRKIEMLEADPLFLAYLQHPRFRGITRQLIGESVAIFRSMFMNKPALRGTVLPYHQDSGAGWGLDRNPIMTVWTSLDDATIANGCVQVIPGSHKLGLLSERSHYLTPEQQAQYCRDDQSVFLEAKAGEAFLLHNWLFHRSGVNTLDRPRRAFSVCYMDAATRYVGEGEQRFPIVFGEGALQPQLTGVR